MHTDEQPWDPGALVEHALTWAALGWPVFPLAPNGKQPLYGNPHPFGSPERHSCRGRNACGKMGHGCLDATTDVELIRQWWERTPIANIGLATGLPGPDVLDVDVKNNAPGMASLERVVKAGLTKGCLAHVATASGGLHLYYEGSNQGNSTMSKFGLDFRGKGGYVVAPPSAVGAGRYEVLRIRLEGDTVDWEAIRNHLNPRPTARVSPRHDTDTPGDPGKLVDWLLQQPEGNRNAALYWAACRALETGASRATLDNLAAAGVQLGLGQHEAQATVDSATRAILRGSSR